MKSASTNKSSSAGKIWFASLLGFLVGVLGDTAYLLLGGIYFFNVPLWSSIVFYPGFITGYRAYDDWHLGEGAAKVIGVLVVGLAYALIAALARWIWITVRRRHNEVHNNTHPSQS
jgi:hypothetical protein